MERNKIRDALIKSITEIQKASGRPTDDITTDTCPETDLGDFDSLNIIEVTFLLSDRLGVEIEDDLLLSDTPISINEMVDRLCQTQNE